TRRTAPERRAALRTAAEPAAAEPATVAAAEAAAIATLVAILLAHHDRRLGLELLDAQRHEAEDIRRKAHAPLHLSDGRGRGFDVEQRIVCLAVLLDLVGEALEAPVFSLGD